MRVTAKPPDVKQMLPHYLAGGRHRELVRLAGGAAPDGVYLHWDQLRHRVPPGGITREEWWLGIKVARGPLYRYLPLRARDDEGEFVVALMPSLEAALQRIDDEAMGEDAIVRRRLTEEQGADALMDEAVHSAQMDGAAIGREPAKEFLRSGRDPITRHERILADTWDGLLHVIEVAGEPLTPELFTEIHQAMTQRTLERGEAGRLRQPHEDPLVHTLRGEPLFDPPIADELPERIGALCAFANGETPDWPVHPVLRAILLHLWVGYEHPFVDGNGRIARAMTLWGLLSQGYPLFEYLPMSRIHRREKTTYERSFLWGVSDGFDSTYFALYALDAIDEGLAALAAGVHPEPPADPGQTPRPARSRPGVTLLPDEIALKSPQATLLPDETTLKHPNATMLEHALAIGATLNERQRALVKRSLREPDEVLTIRAHQQRFGIAYGTARADLQDLFARGLVVRRRVGRSWEYRTVRDAVDRLFE